MTRGLDEAGVAEDDGVEEGRAQVLTKINEHLGRDLFPGMDHGRQDPSQLAFARESLARFLQRGHHLGEAVHGEELGLDGDDHLIAQLDASPAPVVHSRRGIDDHDVDLLLEAAHDRVQALGVELGFRICRDAARRRQEPQSLRDGCHRSVRRLYFPVGLHALDGDGGVALGVEVDQQHALAGYREAVREVDRRRGFADAALLIRQDDGAQSCLMNAAANEAAMGADCARSVILNPGLALVTYAEDKSQALIGLMQRRLRIIRYMFTARIRAAGWAPWLILAGWLIFAVAQEPRMLRRFGIHIVEDAAWVGGLLIAAILLLAQNKVPAVGAAWANLVTLAVVSLAVMMSCRVLDQGPWSATLVDRLADAAAFFAAWAPSSVCLARGSSRSSRGKLVSCVVVFISLVVGGMLSVALREGATRAAWSAAALALLAAALWTRPQNTRK